MKLLLTAALALLVATTASAAGARDQLTAFTQGLKGLDGRFEQRVFDPNGRPTETTRGTVKLSAPRQFRWEVTSPAAQLIVADGDHIWIWDPDLEQVTVRNQSFEEQGSPLTVLIDPTEVALITLGAARTIGLGDEVGSLEVGKWGDLVAMEIPAVTSAEALFEAVLAVDLSAVQGTWLGGREVYRRPA